MKMPSFLNKTTSANTEQTAHLPADLRDDTLKFKVIIDSIEEGVILIDDQQVIRLINPGAAAICGWNADEATNLNINSVIQLVTEKGEAYSPAENPFQQIFTTGENLRVND